MNRRTFSDAVTSRYSSLANDVEDDGGDDDIDDRAKQFRGNVEGEEDEGEVKYDDDDGTAIEPFNLKSDRQAGYFDENMNFVFNKERTEVDSWLANLNEADMEMAIGEAARAVQKQNKIKETADLAMSERRKCSVLEMKHNILKLLKPEETVAGAIRRLSGKSSKVLSINGNKRRMPPNSVSNTTTEVDKGKADELTDLANELLSRGMTSVYQWSYDSIDASTSLWEYKGQDNITHGPFTALQIATWKNQGYFTGTTAVLMRKVIETGNRANDERPSKRSKIASEGDLMDDLESDDEAQDGIDSNTPKQVNEWRLSDEIDFGDPSDFVEANEQESNDNKSQLKGSEPSTRRVRYREDVNVNTYDRDDDVDDDDDPEIDGRINKKSRRKKIKDQDDDDEDDEDNNVDKDGDEDDD